jgi:ribosomal protein S3
VIGVKCWIYNGEILEQKRRVVEKKAAEPVAAAPLAPEKPPVVNPGV